MFQIINCDSAFLQPPCVSCALCWVNTIACKMHSHSSVTVALMNAPFYTKQRAVFLKPGKCGSAQRTCEVSKDSFCPLSGELWPNEEKKNGAIFRVNRNSVAGLHGSHHIPACFCGLVCPSVCVLNESAVFTVNCILIHVCNIMIKKSLLGKC